MSDKCKKVKGGNLERCDAAQYAITNGFIRLQHMHDMATGRTRQQLGLVKGKQLAPFLYCPWCRANIDTMHREQAAAQQTQGGE